MARRYQGLCPERLSGGVPETSWGNSSIMTEGPRAPALSDNSGGRKEESGNLETSPACRSQPEFLGNNVACEKNFPRRMLPIVIDWLRPTGPKSPRLAERSKPGGKPPLNTGAMRMLERLCRVFASGQMPTTTDSSLLRI